MPQNSMERVREVSTVAGLLGLAGVAAACSVAVLVFGTLATILARGYLLACCWAWFITPVFGFRPILTYEAVGLSIVAAVLVPPQMRSTGEPRSTFWKTHRTAYEIWLMAAPSVGFVLTFLGGWVWHTYFMNVVWPWE